MLKTLNSKLKTGLLASVLAMSAGMVMAQGHGMHGGPGEMRGTPEMGEKGDRGGPGMMMGGRHMAHMLDMVDATEAQRAQIKQIMQAARDDLKAQHASGQKLHEQTMALLTAPTVDAAAVEALRQQGQVLREQASKRMSQAMVDAARVLSPEQRAKLGEKMKAIQARRAEHRHEPAGSTGAKPAKPAPAVN